MKLSEITKVNGKNLTQPQKNLLAKLESDYGVMICSTEAQPRVNRFSGATTKPLHPVICALIDFVYEVNTDAMPPTYRGELMDVRIFDRARYLVLALDAEAYSATLD